uniref:Uncharacterized protein n=1 Tax=Coccidioides posadasii RMSCC 3488 TaxID=454284 RepID=A0A0J6IAY2_COCPO|nr:hypothetical protein CPAG_05116 [Coccidioides posadasii RMSCC 3488]
MMTTKERPTYYEVLRAGGNAENLRLRLELFVIEVKIKFPEYATEATELVDQVLRALRHDHGGRRPEDVFIVWLNKKVPNREFFATPEHEETMLKLWERWYDTEQLDKEFWGIRLHHEKGVQYGWMYLTEERVSQGLQCLREWLEGRQANPAC